MKSFAATVALMGMGAEAAFRFAECPEYKPMDTFDKDRYQGIWHDVQHDA